ncbi:CAP domain-containing protein [Streptomyces spongiae]|uniref:CAP domain-containing protein n=1 Tax=Streptomyces spongiae TaxID=565072 RepID=A0A5N8XCG6_9ACTN|nr:CAP domain-containing protein [Streptomyces spongiae]
MTLAAAGVLAATLVPATASRATAGSECADAAAFYDQSPGGGTGSVGTRDAVVCLINAERARHGLAPLTYNQNLTNAAFQHTDQAVRLKWWGPGKDSHTNPQTGSTPQSRIKAAGYCPNPRSWKVSEITYTGWGGSGTPRAAVNWWVNVSTWGHRQIVLDPSLKEIGRWALGGAADPAGANASGAGTYVVTFGSCQPA